jgi:flagellar biosynthetic protein FliO
MKVIVLGPMILALFLVPAYGQLTYTPPAEQVQAAEAQEPEFHFPVARTIGGLGLVVCVMIGAYFAARKLAPRYFTKVGTEKSLKVIETLAMGDRRSISLIEVANNRFLVGNTPHQINLLAALPEAVSLLSEPNTLPANQKDTIRDESRTPFRSLFEVEKKRAAQYMGHPLPEDIRSKMRQLREALER